MAKKKGLPPKRAKRGHKPGGKDSKQPSKKGKKTFNKRAISALKACLKKDNGTNEKDGSNTDNAINSQCEEVKMKTNDGPSNCKLKALKRNNG